MIWRINKNFSSRLYGNTNIRRLKKIFETPDLKDLTKDHNLKKYYDNKTNVLKEKENELLSQTMEKMDNIKDVRPSKMNFKPFLKLNNQRLLGKLKKFSNSNLSFNQEANKKHFPDMFNLDYNAQTLENIRNRRSYKVFCQKTHKISLRNIGLKKEEKELKNLIENHGEFKEFTFHENTLNTFKNNTYSLIDFYPEGSTKIGKKLNEINPLYREKINYVKYDDNEHSLKKYKENKKKLENIRINSVLKNDSNPLLKEILDRGIYKAPLGNNKLTFENRINNGIEVVNTSNDLLAVNKSNINQLSILINDISKTDKHLTIVGMKRDLVFKSKKSKKLIFGDLSFIQIQNYIKFNIGNSKELFGIMKEYIDGPTKKKMLNNILVSSFNNHFKWLKNQNLNSEMQSTALFPIILQKISTKFIDRFAVKNNNLLNLVEYKILLNCIKENLKNYELKMLTDTFYGISLIHREDRTYFPEFFQHLMIEFMSSLDLLIKQSVIKNVKDYNSFKVNLQIVSVICSTLAKLRLNETNNFESTMLVKMELEKSIFKTLSLAENINDLNFFGLSNIIEYLNSEILFNPDYLKLGSSQSISIKETFTVLEKILKAILNKYTEIDDSERISYDTNFLSKSINFICNVKKFATNELYKLKHLENTTNTLSSINSNMLKNILDFSNDILVETKNQVIKVKENLIFFNEIALITHSFSSIKEFDSDLFERLLFLGKDKLEILEYDSFDSLLTYFQGICLYFSRNDSENSFDHIFNDYFYYLTKPYNVKSITSRYNDARFTLFDYIFKNFDKIKDMLKKSEEDVSIKGTDFNNMFKVLYHMYLLGYSHNEILMGSIQLFINDKHKYLRSIGYIMQIMCYKKFKPFIFKEIMKTFAEMQSEIILLEPSHSVMIFTQVLSSMFKLNITNTYCEQNILTNEELAIILNNSVILLNTINIKLVSKNKNDQNLTLNDEEFHSLYNNVSTNTLKNYNSLCISVIALMTLRNIKNNIVLENSNLLMFDDDTRNIFKYINNISYDLLSSNEKYLLSYLLKCYEYNNIKTEKNDESVKLPMNIDTFSGEIFQKTVKFEKNKNEELTYDNNSLFFKSLKNILKKNLNKMIVKDKVYDVVVDFSIDNCFVVPFYIRELDLAILLYSDNEIESTDNLSGHTFIREQLIKRNVKNLEIIWREKSLITLESNEDACYSFLKQICESYINM